MDSPTDQAAARRQALAMLALTVGLFGTAWPIMKVVLDSATPILFAAARAAVGSLAAFALLGALGRLRRPSRRDAPIIASIGILQISGFIGLSNLGLVYVPVGRSAVIAYTMSLWLVPLSLLVGERIDARQAAGVALGLAGIATLFNPFTFDWSNAEAVGGNLVLLLGALSWALAIIHTRRHVWRLSPMEMMPWAMLLATLTLGLMSLLFEPGRRIEPTPTVLWSLAYLGILAGPLASWSATTVARILPPVVSAIGFLGVPALGVILSAWWLGEPVAPLFLAGAALIFGGVVLVTTAPAKPG